MKITFGSHAVILGQTFNLIGSLLIAVSIVPTTGYLENALGKFYYVVLRYPTWLRWGLYLLIGGFFLSIVGSVIQDRQNNKSLTKKK